jgi:hypothetical protein
MIIFRTSPSTIEKVIKLQQHALRGKPTRLKEGDLVLLSLNVSPNHPRPLISHVMEFDHLSPDVARDSEKHWGKYWPWMLYFKSCLPLARTFVIQDEIGLKKIYGAGGGTVYVDPYDEALIIARGRLETTPRG